jgi:hypothetical protein
MVDQRLIGPQQLPQGVDLEEPPGEVVASLTGRDALLSLHHRGEPGVCPVDTGERAHHGSQGLHELVG